MAKKKRKPDFSKPKAQTNENEILDIEEEPDYNSVLTVAKELVKGDKK